ncbi:uracil-DNA glycosylase family protein [Bradymonas sediminis]|uniref:Single-stranded DNA-binding protein n=1 Tax=Bradymonas sediminis TaxID=1548548 RepID=A0A2Z4FN28_9DELT|nr:uracil-DNA glycosylase family protein [Bradymonas sediminis]AWV90250.1 single-stranded DNA-binding protein [Bradymonas sediminis]TDP75781.1 single-strand selective monofunctional uracil DNA glycosylase [Bradymonas sediminis]
MKPSPIEITHALRDALIPLEFSAPVTHVYNPLLYAGAMYEAYLERFGARAPREIVLVGMNPGPWGMAQNGVPFGEVNFVRDWMGFGARPESEMIGKPANEHPKRPVVGLDCHRNEVSGARLWGWAEQRYGSAEEFFSRYYVHNYCPLVFMEESGRNRTPNRLSAAERSALFEPCDRALRQTLEYLQPKFVVGIGNFAEKRVKATLADAPELRERVVVGRILHPSPASPKANRGWAEQAEAELRAIGVEV